MAISLLHLMDVVQATTITSHMYSTVAAAEKKQNKNKHLTTITKSSPNWYTCVLFSASFNESFRLEK